MDTPSEHVFDDLVKLTSRLCDVPIALVSLVARERQWFKARVGLDATETSIDVSFCAHAIRSPDEALIVPDATADERFRENPLVTGDPSIRAYAGIPLVLRSGEAVGTLCAIDRKPRQFTRDQQEALKVLGAAVTSQLELRAAARVIAESKVAMERMMANAPGVLYRFFKRPDGCEGFEYIGDRCDAFMGVSAAEVMGDASTFKRNVLPEDVHVMEEARSEAFKYVAPCRWEVRVRVAGEERWVRGQSRPTRRPDGVNIWDGILLDVTAEKRAEAESAAARLAAEKASVAKSQFLATMSHEIRTPINSVIGMTGLLLSEPLDPKAARFARLARTSGQILLSLINNILDFSKIEAGKLELSPVEFDVRSMVESVVEVTGVRAKEKFLPIEASVAEEVPGRVWGDQDRLRQVLMNLVSNAVKFTERGKVSVEVRRGEGDSIEFAVRDTGIGIPADRVGLLFRSFQQVDSGTTRKFGGTGLGLAISKQLVELFGGTIWAESVEGEGTAFRFRVPLPARAGAPDAIPISRGANPGQRDRSRFRVLAAEDNEFNQVLVGALLERAGCQYEIVDNGIKAVQAVLAGDFDVVLMDCQMPEMDGYEATRELRKKPKGRAIPIIALTADAVSGDREACLSAGMDDYLSKPIDTDAFHLALDRWCGRKVSHAA